MVLFLCCSNLYDLALYLLERSVIKRNTKNALFSCDKLKNETLFYSLWTDMFNSYF